MREREERGGEKGELQGRVEGDWERLWGEGRRGGGGGQVKREREKQGVTVWVTHSNMSRK